MKYFVFVLALVAAATADVSHIVSRAAVGSEVDATVLRQAADVGADQYQYEYQTSNGISAQESGVLKNAGREDEAVEVQGSNQYTAPDGQSIQTSYIANENGYQPQGAHLPTPPPPPEIPEYILRSLEYIRTHPPKPEPGQLRP